MREDNAMQYQRKPAQTEAVRAVEDTTVESNHGPIPVKAGEWIITNGDEQYPCTDEEFRKRHIMNAKPCLFVDLGWALEQLRAGHRVRRTGWNGTGMFLVRQAGYPQGIGANANTANAFGVSEGSAMRFRPYIVISPPDKFIVPWVCSQTDLLGEDWELAD